MNNIATTLSGRKILCIAFPFFGYEKIIKAELENMGAEVDFYPGKFHPEDFRDNANTISALIQFLINPFYRKRYTDDILEFIESKRAVYDILFAIQTFPASRKLITALKRANPALKSYIYFWDSFKLFNYSDRMKYFDYAFSLDRNDCKKHKKLIHLHGFYPGINKNIPKESAVYDWSYTGSVYPMSSYRIDVINALIEYSKKNNLSYYARLKYYELSPHKSKIRMLLRKICHHIFDRKTLWFYKKIKENAGGGFLFTGSIPLDEVMKIQGRSRCVVDIGYRNRAGITFQCFPVIARNQKLVTTNKYIAREDFYRPENILIIDEENPKIDREFLQKPFVPVDISHLRLDNWLKTIFGIREEVTSALPPPPPVRCRNKIMPVNRKGRKKNLLSA